MKRLFKEAFAFIFLSFTSVNFYRDVAYRQKGYGLKNLWAVFIILFIPTLVNYSYHVYQLYQHQWKTDTSLLPTLKMVDEQILKREQDLETIQKIDALGQYSWIEKNQVPTQAAATTNYFIGNGFFMIRVPNSTWFGFQFNNKDLFMPAIIWRNLKEPIDGKAISASLNPGLLFSVISLFIFFNFLMMLNISCLFVVSFSYVAAKMIRLIINDYNPEHKMVCRLLSVSMIPTLVLAAIITDFFSYQDFHKYFYIFFYMLNFNIAVRFVRKRSDMTSLEVSSSP